MGMSITIEVKVTPAKLSKEEMREKMHLVKNGDHELPVPAAESSEKTLPDE